VSLLDAVEKVFAVMACRHVILLVRPKIVSHPKAHIQSLKNCWIVVGEIADKRL